MRKTREILRLKLEVGHSHRTTARALGVSVGVVGETASRAKRSGLDWKQVCGLTDELLEERLYGPRPGEGESATRPMPDFAEVHAERMRPGVTLALLHYEYQQGSPGGYGYTQFCEYYRRWLGVRGLTMRQDHSPATSCSSTTPARSRSSWTPRRVSGRRSSCSSRSWARRTIPMPK